MTLTTLAAPSIEFKTTCLVIPENLTFDQWMESCLGTAQVEQSSRWWLGDILAFGEDRFPIQWSQVLDSKFADQHRGRMRVSRRIPPEIRRESLSWSAHREAASAETIEERIELLDMAVANGWGAREIATEVRRRRNSRQDNGGPPLDNDNDSAGQAGAAAAAANNTSGAMNPALPKQLPQAVLACLTEIRKLIYVITSGEQLNVREMLRVCVLTEAVLAELLRTEPALPATL